MVLVFAGTYFRNDRNYPILLVFIFADFALEMLGFASEILKIA